MFQETHKDAKENVGELKRLVRESKVLERLGSYLAMVRNITDSKPMTFAQAFD